MALLVAWLWAGAGCRAPAYRATDPRLGSTPVISRADFSEPVLTTWTEAGRYPVREVRLRLADGRELEPAVQREEPERRRGGVPVGVGIGGIGAPGPKGGMAMSVGGQRRMGGTVLPGRVMARFEPVSADSGPWTLVVRVDALDGSPKVTVGVPLEVSGEGGADAE